MLRENVRSKKHAKSAPSSGNFWIALRNEFSS
jgi:hypothetical protein